MLVSSSLPSARAVRALGLSTVHCGPQTLRAVVPGVQVAPRSIHVQSSYDRQANGVHADPADWTVERAERIAREKILLAELSAVRQQVDVLLAQNSKLVEALCSGVGSSNGPQAAAERAAETASSSTAEAVASSANGNVPGPAATTSWEQVFQSDDAAPVQSREDSIARTIAAAIQAVDKYDVLSDDIDYSSLELTFESTLPVPRQAAADSPLQAAGTAPAPQAAYELSEAQADAAVGVRPEGPPPLLKMGDDDIYWVDRLQKALVSKGFYPDDEELETWMFEGTTHNALLTFQACNGLAETGITDEATWAALIEADVTAAEQPTATAPPAPSVAAADAPSPAPELGAAASSSARRPGAVGGSSWPVVMDGDGGHEVHALQVALGRRGYSCGDDEMTWWQFGDSTGNALRTFQVCSGLPETGVCHEHTWRALLGPDARPDDIALIKSEAYEDDMTAPHAGAVWLIGEQRWSDPKRTWK